MAGDLRHSSPPEGDVELAGEPDVQLAREPDVQLAREPEVQLTREPDSPSVLRAQLAAAHRSLSALRRELKSTRARLAQYERVAL